MRRLTDLPRTLALATALGAAALLATPGRAAEAPPGTQPCRLKGVEHGAWCGVLTRPLDPSRADGPTIDLHYAVLPALARNKKPDPVFFFAGGPGQSAIGLAGQVAVMLARFGNRRDLVLVDQRGTGRSAPLHCDEDVPTRPLRETATLQAQFAEVSRCRQALRALPHGDLRFYTTAIAMQDVDAVRRALGAERINLVGASYGTRAALEVLRQFPQAVRRVVLDGLAPPDMVLPASFSADGQAAFDAALAACEADVRCRARYPALRAQWQALLDGLPREVAVAHPVSGVVETLTLTRDMLVHLVRQPLYSPLLASALPHALAEAAQGRLTPLFGLGRALAGGREQALAMGQHFSVVCAEDAPLMDRAAAAPAADFGSGFADFYRRVCADWPRGEVPAAFYTMPPAPVATLLLSGGLDPATPPRHGERVAQALGARARHVVVDHAGHGVMALGCLREAVFRFVDAETDAQALQVDAGCAQGVPRPPVFVPVAGEGGAEAAR